MAAETGKHKGDKEKEEKRGCARRPSPFTEGRVRAAKPGEGFCASNENDG
jgi:hypothetical protein